MVKEGNNYVYTYDPADKTHDVEVLVNGEHVEGSPFQLAPKKNKNKGA